MHAINLAANKNKKKRLDRLKERWSQADTEMHWTINRAEITASMSPEGWTYGSDEEKALLKAITDYNPRAVIRVCVDHMYDNFVRACTQFCISQEQRQEMWEYMTAMVRIRSDASFDDKRRQIERYWVTNRGRDEEHDGSDKRQLFGAKLLQYVDKLNRYHRIPYLQARREHTYKIGLHFSNNNAESVNSAVKRAVHYSPTPAPALIEKLHLMMKTQVTDAYRSLIGTGNYDLAPEFEDHFVGRSEWEEYYSDKQRELAMLATLRADAKYRPLQRKRRQAEMTRSASGATSILSAPGNKVIRKPKVNRKGHTRPRAESAGRARLST